MWDQACQNAFNSINQYLLNLPVLMSPALGKPSLLYVATMESSLGAMLAQHNEEGNEHALYYLCWTMVNAKLNYSPIEKIYLALIFILQKLRHYLLTTMIHLIPRANPLKYIMSHTLVQGHIAKCIVLLLKFNIHYVPQRAVKGQVLADFLATHLVPNGSPRQMEFPNENVMQVQIKKDWKIFFDGASRGPFAALGDYIDKSSRVDIIFVTPDNGIIMHSLTLTEGH